MRRLIFGALLALAALTALPTTAHAALQWRSCVDFNGVQCATLDVPLDRANTMPGTVPLRIARAGRRSGPTLMYLSGGPGGAGVSEMIGVLAAVPFLLDRFRVIGFDQRGTGRSGLLRCPRLEKDPYLRDTGAAEECAARIGPARRFYTTPDSVQDMEAIRQQLGSAKLTLFGISYGTELAVAYARAFPQHVERLILDSVVDYDDRDPFATVNFRAMGPSLKSLCPGGCRGISADPGADLAKLVAQLRVTPLQAFAYDRLGRSTRVRITPTALFDLMLLTDYLPALRAAVPAGVQAALKGDGALLARLIREARRLEGFGSPRDFSVARYSTVCETTPLPWDPGTPIEARAAITQQRLAAVAPNAFAPFDAAVVLEDEIDLCLRWPDVPRPVVDVPAPPYPTVPTLILQGNEDLRTPPEWSQNVASRIPGAHRIVIRGVGHSTVSDPRDCAASAILRFVTRRTPPRTCKRVPTGVPAVLSAPASFESLRGLPGYSRKTGRTLRAVLATIDDLDLVLSPATLASAGGGLRGGSWSVAGRRLRLSDYQAVTGVTVGGGGDLTRSLTLRIAGTKAAKGTLVLNARGLTGRLGGRPVRLRLDAARASLVHETVQLQKLAR
ncbi:alpha/beta fold hydrolase [Solirubrobacter sp. CPCC 204708]|uniref:Alpha/beta hydrolase n=1 Tax=Solirubrobacter deserti TaxID=2282478 RepID=A0ABT4RH24_9ACTN|nr:alpha/beta fold hydrolase [Solirubrobacter deserti]MBE2315323.1 alpha/beta fold hydrolase [Solirubrobacter deserti]MDA0137832.1 alpha/beta hydrolase [Solirubrobacter deserti]